MNQKLTNQFGINIGAAILAGGKSTRFNGQNKALINVLGGSILDRNIITLQSIFKEIHIISNTNADFIYTGIPVFKDIFENKGPLGGIYSALLHSGCEAVFIFSCDMPFLSKNLIKNIIINFTKSNSQILIPQIFHKIEPLHAIYSTSILPILENYIKSAVDYKIRLFFPKVSTSYLALDNSQENQKAFLNINSPDDLSSIASFF